MSTSSPQSTADPALIPLPANESIASTAVDPTLVGAYVPITTQSTATTGSIQNGVAYAQSTASAVGADHYQQMYSAYAMQYQANPVAAIPGTYPQSAYAYNAQYSQYYAYAQQQQQTQATATATPLSASGSSSISTIKKGNKTSQKSQSTSADEFDDDDDPTIDRGQSSTKASNVLPIWGNEKTMNLNSLVLTNILQSPYFKVNLFALKTYHEVIDEIYYNVKHLEPWERGSRKTSGQTGMCGSVRGVGAGGIVSTPFCILYKLFTLRLTRKQLVGLLKHKDSPYIRALGFMYIRFTQPPNTFWKWFEPYLEDDEPVEVKSGVTITIGELCRQLMIKLDWYSTLFPRMPIPVQKEIEKKLTERGFKSSKRSANEDQSEDYRDEEDDSERAPSRDRERNNNRNKYRSPERSRNYRSRSPSPSRERKTNRNWSGRGGRDHRDYDRDYERKDRNRRTNRSRSRSRDRFSSHKRR